MIYIVLNDVKRKIIKSTIISTHNVNVVRIREHGCDTVELPAPPPGCWLHWTRHDLEQVCRLVVGGSFCFQFVSKRCEEFVISYPPYNQASPFGCFLIASFACIHLFSSMLSFTVSVFSWRTMHADVWLEGVGGKTLEDGSIDGREGPSDRWIQSHSAVQPAVAGGTQERRRCSEEILKTVKRKRKRKRKLQTDSRLADWRIWCWKRWSMFIVSPYLFIFKNTYQSISLLHQHVPMFFIVSDWRESFHVNTYQATSFWGTYKPPSLFSLSIAKLKAKAQPSIFLLF